MKDWRKYLTSSFLILTIATSLILVKSYFVLQENRKFNKILNKRIIVSVNDRVFVNKSVKTDTINIYVKSHISNTIQVDSTSSDTIMIDSSQLNNVK